LPVYIPTFRAYYQPKEFSGDVEYTTKFTLLEGGGDPADFWLRLPELDDDFEKRRLKLDEEGKRWRFVATMDHGQTSVALKEIAQGHPFYNLEGSNNIVTLTTTRYKEYPLLIQGFGACASVTAAGVFANILSIANI
jgi:aspartokinase/homoserine dehydrogenase 1